MQSERDVVSSLVREINDILAFLAPDRDLRLDLVRSETHTYPDIGQAQEVVNRQIPVDYDIFMGIMWGRCGGPTASSQGGTIEEFQRALSRRERTGRPIIMFYFCDESVPFPRADDLEQLTKVVRFRDELTSKGYTLIYPSRAEFRDHVRSGLLRAIADLLGERVQLSQGPAIGMPRNLPPDGDRDAVARLAAQYDEIKRMVPSSRDRTNKLSEIAAALRVRSPAVRSMLAEYQNSDSAGLRLAAICILQQFPNPLELAWLAERLDPDKEAPFLGYAAAQALAQAVRSLPPAHYADLEKKYVTLALSLAERNPNDLPRIRVLNTALNELRAKISIHQEA